MLFVIITTGSKRLINTQNIHFKFARTQFYSDVLLQNVIILQVFILRFRSRFCTSVSLGRMSLSCKCLFFILDHKSWEHYIFSSLVLARHVMEVDRHQRAVTSLCVYYYYCLDDYCIDRLIYLHLSKSTQSAAGLKAFWSLLPMGAT